MLGVIVLVFVCYRGLTIIGIAQESGAAEGVISLKGLL